MGADSTVCCISTRLSVAPLNSSCAYRSERGRSGAAFAGPGSADEPHGLPLLDSERSGCRRADRAEWRRVARAEHRNDARVVPDRLAADPRARAPEDRLRAVLQTAHGPSPRAGLPRAARADHHRGRGAREAQSRLADPVAPEPRRPERRRSSSSTSSARCTPIGAAKVSAPPRRRRPAPDAQASQRPAPDARRSHAPQMEPRRAPATPRRARPES